MASDQPEPKSPSLRLAFDVTKAEIVRSDVKERDLLLADLTGHATPEDVLKKAMLAQTGYATPEEAAKAQMGLAYGIPQSTVDAMAIPLSLTNSVQAIARTNQSAASSLAYSLYGPSPADMLLIAEAKAAGVDVDKVPIEDLRGLGMGGLYALREKQELSKRMASLRGDLSAYAGISSGLADLTSKTSAAYAMADIVRSHSATNAVSDAMAAMALRGTGFESVGVRALTYEQELSKQMASLRGEMSAYAGISSGLADLTSQTSAAYAMAAIACHGSGFRSAWLEAHTGGVEQYAKELAHLIQPLASIREAVGTWDGVLAAQFDHLAGTSTYLQASGVAADRLLSLAMTPEGRKESPSWVAERFMQHELSDGLHGEIAFPLVPVLPSVKHREDRDRLLEKALRKERRRRKKAEDRAERAEEDAAQSKEMLRRVTEALELVYAHTLSRAPLVEQKGAFLAVTTTAVVEVTEPEAASQNSAQSVVPPLAEPADIAKLATREQLIDAFGKFTGMDDSWFDNLKDTPALKAARKVSGRGGRKFAVPLFCPFEVMQWLISPKRRKGKRMQPDTGWRLLERWFLDAYNAHSVGDPRQD